MNPCFWRITFLGNRPQLLLAREPSDGFSVPDLFCYSHHIRPSTLSLFPSLPPVLYFQPSQLPKTLFSPLGQSPVAPSLSHPLVHTYGDLYRQTVTGWQLRKIKGLIARGQTREARAQLRGHTNLCLPSPYLLLDGCPGGIAGPIARMAFAARELSRTMKRRFRLL